MKHQLQELNTLQGEQAPFSQSHASIYVEHVNASHVSEKMSERASNMLVCLAGEHRHVETS